MYRLSLFGAFSLAGPDGAEIRLKSRKAMALLAYLARPPGMPRSRQEIMALLWSDRGEAQARASLRQVLAQLRRALGGEADTLLIIKRDSVTLNAGCVTLGEPGDGTFLAGLDIADPAFDDWLRDERMAGETASEKRAASADAKDDDARPRIAVLPFTNLSEERGQQYFADGITEDLITELARFNSLRVIGRSSSFAVQDQAGDSAAAAAERLGARYVVVGSVRMAAGRVRVAAQLIDARSGEHIWSDRYDRELQDIFAVQDDLVSSVVTRLGFSLGDMAMRRARSRPTASLTAYDLLLQARFAWWHGHDAEAFACTRRAVEADPDYAAAHAYFALQHAYQYYGGTLGLDWDVIAEKCRHHAELALSLDDTDPIIHAYASMAFGFSPLRAKERGLHHIALAIGLNPHDCELMLFHAWQMTFAGEHEKALALLDKVSVLNPLGGYVIAECYTDACYMVGDYHASLNAFRNLGVSPPQAMTVFAACHARLGDAAAAQEVLATLERTKPAGFEATRFARAQIATCLREEDREHWRQGFRGAGLSI